MEMVGGKAPTPLCVFNRKPSSLAAFFLDTRFPSPPNKRGAGFLLTATGPPIPPILPVFLLSLFLSLRGNDEETSVGKSCIRNFERVIKRLLDIFFFFFTTRVYFFKRDLCEKALSLWKKNIPK